MIWYKSRYLCANYACLSFVTETSASTRLQPRLRDEKKVTEASKQKSTTASDDTMDTTKTGSPEDVYEFKSVKESDSSPDHKSMDTTDMETENTDPLSIPTSQAEDSSKRNFSEISDPLEESGNDDESRRKKRKEEGGAKDSKAAPAQRNSGQNKGQGNKQGSAAQTKANLASTKTGKFPFRC